MNNYMLNGGAENHVASDIPSYMNYSGELNSPHNSQGTQDVSSFVHLFDKKFTLPKQSMNPEREFVPRSAASSMFAGRGQGVGSATHEGMRYQSAFGAMNSPSSSGGNYSRSYASPGLSSTMNPSAPSFISSLGSGNSGGNSSMYQDQGSSYTSYQSGYNGTPQAYFYSEQPTSSVEQSLCFLVPEVFYPRDSELNNQHAKGRGQPRHFHGKGPDMFFVRGETRYSLLQKCIDKMRYTDRLQAPDVPEKVGKDYIRLMPLDQRPPPSQSRFYTLNYKALKISHNMKPYCLHRVVGGPTSIPPMSHKVINLWKELEHPNVVTLREFSFSREFSEDSLVFVYDYHPCTVTLQSFLMTRFSPKKKFAGPRPISHGLKSMVPEDVIWRIVIQVVMALRAIHQHGLAYRSLSTSKLLIDPHNDRLRLNCCGVIDVLQPSPVDNVQMVQHHQQEDLMSLGLLITWMVTGDRFSAVTEAAQKLRESTSPKISADLQNLTQYLLDANQEKTFQGIAGLIGSRFFEYQETLFKQSDFLESELTKEMDNGRLFRLIAQLNIILERNCLRNDQKWSETEARYLLRLFRDFIFHEVNEQGAPLIDLAHIVQCLNKLDVGSEEKIQLVSHDSRNIIIVSFAELKRYFEKSFEEIVEASQLQ